MRKIIQLVHLPETDLTTLSIVALCDDGSLFIKGLQDKDKKFAAWQKLEDIPQDEPKRDFIGQSETNQQVPYKDAWVYKLSNEYWPENAQDMDQHRLGYTAYLDGMTELSSEEHNRRFNNHAWLKGWKLANRIHAK